MKNIESILKKFGLEIPEDKQKDFTKLFEENYKTISELENVKNNLEKQKEKYEEDIKKRDADLAKVSSQLEDAKNQLNEAKVDADKIEKLQSTIDELEGFKTKYSEEKKNYEKMLEDQKYEFAIKEKANSLQFTSNAAKKAFISDLMNDKLTVKDGEVLGFDDFVKSYGEKDAGVFVKEETKKKSDKKPSFTKKTESNDSGDGNDDGGETVTRPVIW